MKHRTESTSTVNLLVDLIEGGFGAMTVDRKRFNIDAGDERFPARSFFYDRRKNNTDKPINARCALYIEHMYRLVFQANTRYDRFQTSSKLALVIGKAAGKNLSKYALTPGDSRQIQRENAELLLRLLSLLMEHARDREIVDKRDFGNEVNILLRESRESQYSARQSAVTTPLDSNVDGIRFLPDSVVQACFPMRIAQAMRSMDIASFHGTQWIKANRDALEERISRGHITIRVALADPDSDFMEPYARLKGPGAEIDARPDIIRRRIEAAEETWLEICGRAIANGALGVELEISRFRQVPAFAIHRFDSVLLLTLNHNPAAGSYFPAFECVDTGQPFCAYRMLVKEFDELMNDEPAPKRKRLSSAETFEETVLRYDVFLQGLADACGDGKEAKKIIETISKTPQNSETALRFTHMIESALEQESLPNAIEASRSIAQFILEATSIDLRENILTMGDTNAIRAAKNGKVLRAIRIMINSMTRNQIIDMQVAKSLIE